jgi:hypothetical protein
MSARNRIAVLNNNLKRWLQDVANRWRISVADTVKRLTLGWGEIANRTGQYPELGDELRRSRLNTQNISNLLHGCYTFMDQFDAIRLTDFFNDSRSTSAVLSLIRSFPRNDGEAAKRIDAFVQRAVETAYKTRKGGNDFSGATLLASVLLTALEPSRFVDFRRSRWEALAEGLSYQFSEIESYGEWLVQAGHFAQGVCRTKTFRRYWPDQEPLWALSGICWIGRSPKPPHLPQDDFPDESGFPEGRKRKELHCGHERNQTVVKLAKQYASLRDETLPCEVCEFSFIKKYGELGDRFIEAHHKKAVASLKPGQRTKVPDIALVCANCHRMLHAGKKTLSVEELRKLLCD